MSSLKSKLKKELLKNNFKLSNLVSSNRDIYVYDFNLSSNHLYRVSLSDFDQFCVCHIESYIDNEKHIHIDRLVIKKLCQFKYLITNQARSPLFNEQSLTLP